MPRNAQGLYTLPSGNPVISGTEIESVWANTTMDDLAAALTGSLPRNGSAPMTGPLILSTNSPQNPKEAASKAFVEQFMAFASGMPVGAVTAFAGTTAPAGWLLCDGSAVSRTTYDVLFAAIGVTYGPGDASTTFNLPDMRDEFIRGKGGSRVLGSKQSAAFASHNHGVGDPGHAHGASQTAHDHVITTGGHSHGVNDPGHAHSANSQGLENTNLQQGGPYDIWFHPGSTGVSGTGISIATVGNLGGVTDLRQPGVTVNGAVTGLTIGAAGGDETRPQNIAQDYYIKAVNDSAGSASITGIDTSDAQMISVDNANLVSPELVIHSNVAFGTVKLDASGQIPLGLLPSASQQLLGYWNASGGQTPSQASPSTNFASGDTFIISVSGLLTVFDPVTLVASPTTVAVGSLLQFIENSVTNPTGWYYVVSTTTVTASQVSFLPVGEVTSTNVQDAIEQVDQRVLEAITVKLFGAVGDGVTDDSAAFTAADSAGMVVVPSGTYRIGSNIAITKSMLFALGASITVDVSATVTITGIVESPRQQIFKGDGAVALSSESSRYAHASWFGAFVSQLTDQAPAINKAFAAMGNSRESVVEFDIGNYRLETGISVTRASCVKGQGTRRTVFNVRFNTGDVFTTLGEGCRFEGIQFEVYDSGGAPTNRTSGAFINAAHDYCLFDDIAFSSGYGGLLLDGAGCQVSNVQCLAGSTGGSGSYIIKMTRGGCVVDKVWVVGTGGPESIVLVRGAGESFLNNFNISNVFFNTPSIGVNVVADGALIIRQGSISNIQANGAGGSAVSIANSGSGSVTSILIDNVDVAATMTNGVSINQSGTSTIGNILLSNVICAAVAGSGILLTRSAGTLRDITIGVCDIRLAAVPITKSGTMTGVTVSPQTQNPRVNPALTYDTSINDDAVYSVNLGVNIFSGAVLVTAGHVNYGLFAVRAASSPGITPISVSANVAGTTGVLTGTTGADGKLTVSVNTSGMIYVENRLGSSQRVEITVMTGIIS